MKKYKPNHLRMFNKFIGVTIFIPGMTLFIALDKLGILDIVLGIIFISFGLFMMTTKRRMF